MQYLLSEGMGITQEEKRFPDVKSKQAMQDKTSGVFWRKRSLFHDCYHLASSL